MGRAIVMLCVAALVAGCGSGATERDASAPPGAPRAPGVEPTPEAGFDPDDAAVSTVPADGAEIRLLVAEAGRRRDFRVPREVLAGKPDGPLVLAWVARPFYRPPDGDAWVHRLNRDQLAVYALFLADFDILEGGFGQLWANSSGSIAHDLVTSAERVGAKEHAAIFRAAAALWPGGRIPRSRAARQRIVDRLPEAELEALDARYAATQDARRTALGPLLARFIRANPKQFVAG